MTLTSGKVAQFVMVFALPVGVSESDFVRMLNDGISVSARMMQHARGAVCQFVPEQSVPPSLAL